LILLLPSCDTPPADDPPAPAPGVAEPSNPQVAPDVEVAQSDLSFGGDFGAKPNPKRRPTPQPRPQPSDCSKTWGPIDLPEVDCQRCGRPGGECCRTFLLPDCGVTTVCEPCGPRL